MRREFLKHADWNVIVVDWAGGSLPLYTQATANTRLVGLEVAYFVNYLKVGAVPALSSLLHCITITERYQIKDLSFQQLSGSTRVLCTGSERGEGVVRWREYSSVRSECITYSIN